MIDFNVTNNNLTNSHLPEFSITVEDSKVTVLYSDADMQSELTKGLKTSGKATVFDWHDGLYDRLTVESNLKFYHKWFRSDFSLSEILVLFQLHQCGKKPLKQCSTSEIRRIYYAKYFMSSSETPFVFVEPVHGVDILTMDTFITMLKKLKDMKIPVLVLVANLEHALLLGDIAYKLDKKGLHFIDIETDEETPKLESVPSIVNLYKVPAKVDDKVILFDPTEIDYIESQDGKAQIVINNESFTLDSTLAEIEKKLEFYGFYRCHRSYIVNLQKVREIITWSKNTYSLKIDNQVESTIPLSRSKIQEIQGIFNLK